MSNQNPKSQTKWVIAITTMPIIVFWLFYFCNSDFAYWVYKSTGLSVPSVNINKNTIFPDKHSIENKIISVTEKTLPTPPSEPSMGGPIAWYHADIPLYNHFLPIYVDGNATVESINKVIVARARTALANQGFTAIPNVLESDDIFDYDALLHSSRNKNFKYEIYWKGVTRKRYPLLGHYRTYVVIMFSSQNSKENKDYKLENIYGFVTAVDCANC